tara:strand:+ start:1196 stop:2077 length:882 start_codon:yes stop_codon:yes gene_type:complete
MSFSATEAAFEGFRVVRRKPLTVIFWALAYIAMMGTLFALAGGSIASLMAAMEGLQGSQEPSPEQMAAIWRGYLPLFALVIPVSLLFGSVMNAAVVRSVVRPEQSAFGYLRLGMDELRTLAVTIVLAVLYGIFMMVAAMAVGILAGFAANADIPALWILVVLAGLGLVVLLVWLAVRFSLAVPITVAEGRIAIFDSFAMTRKHVWPLIGMAIIAWIMSMVVGLLGGLVALPVTMLLGTGGDLATMDGQTTLQILQAAWPMVAGWIAVQSVLSALQLAVVYAPYSAAYRDLKAG